MANTYFQFKQFRIEQDKTAMKVSTDSCLFGALTAEWLRQQGSTDSWHILDIGTGTGLLSLMIAQQCGSEIDAVELDFAAYEQACFNFSQSPWQARIRVLHEDITKLQTGRKYDFILSNPPFYEHDLTTGNREKDLARHDRGLTFEHLIRAIKDKIKGKGVFAILLPFQRVAAFDKLANETGFHCFNNILIQQTPRHGWFRSIRFYSGDHSIAGNSQISIRDSQNNYGERFTELLKPYYLNL